MRSKHCFDRGITSREEFVEAHEPHNTSLVSRLGGFPVDSIWLCEETRGIIIYGNHPAEDGVEIIARDEPLERTTRGSMARLFPLHPPGEWITKVVVHKPQAASLNPLAVTVSPPWPCLAYLSMSLTGRCLGSSKQTGTVNFIWVLFKVTGIHQKRCAHPLAIPSRGSIFSP